MCWGEIQGRTARERSRRARAPKLAFDPAVGNVARPRVAAREHRARKNAPAAAFATVDAG